MKNKRLILQFELTDYSKQIDCSILRPLALAKLYYSYILYHQKLDLKTDSSLYTEASMIKHFFTFLETRKIKKLNLFDYGTLQEFFSFLKTITTKRGKHLSQSSQRLTYTFFKNFSIWLYKHHREKAPDLTIFQRSPYIGNNDKLKSDYLKDSVLKQIKQALIIEENIYTKTYILILLYYGLRSQDIVSLTSNSLQQSNKNGRYDLIYHDHKKKEMITIPAIEPRVSNTIRQLMLINRPFQKKTGLDFIFLKETKKGIKKFNSYQKILLDSFVKRHHIVDENNNLVSITAHIFRRTLATNLQSSGATLDTIQSVLNHASKRTTIKYYIKTKQSDYIEQITKLLEVMQIITTETSSSIVKSDNKTTIQLSDGYCTNNNMLEDDENICQHLLKRGNCYGCSQMVTTPEFLPYFQKLLERKEEEIKSAYHYGEHLLQNIQFEKELITSLIKKLEAL